MAKQYFYLQDVEIDLEDLRVCDHWSQGTREKAQKRIITAIMDCLDPVQLQMVQGGDGPTLWDARLMALYICNQRDSVYLWEIHLPRHLYEAMLDWYAAWDCLPDWRKRPDEFLPPCVTCGKTVSDKAHRDGWRLCDDCLRQAHDDRRADVKMEERALGFYACYKD